MDLKNRIKRLEDYENKKIDEINLDVKGSRFYISDKEISITELKEISDKCKKIIIGGFIDGKGTELIGNIEFTCDVEGAVKGYKGLSPNNWDEGD